MEVSPALAALREATGPAHGAIEHSLAIASPGAGKPEYAAHVALLWGWLDPFESELWRGEWPEDIAATLRQGKTHWLLEDIRVAQAEGLLVGPVPRRAAVPAFDSLATRMGWAYVVEGSMLGGQVLLKRLGPRLAPWPLRWLRGYGDEGGAKWRAFLQALATHVTRPEDIRAASVAAVEAFESLAQWSRETRQATRAPAWAAPREAGSPPGT